MIWIKLYYVCGGESSDEIYVVVKNEKVFVKVFFLRLLYFFYLLIFIWKFCDVYFWKILGFEDYYG